MSTTERARVSLHGRINIPADFAIDGLPSAEEFKAITDRVAALENTPVAELAVLAQWLFRPAELMDIQRLDHESIRVTNRTAYKLDIRVTINRSTDSYTLEPGEGVKCYTRSDEVEVGVSFVTPFLPSHQVHINQAV